jgi:hypothetical protein
MDMDPVTAMSGDEFASPNIATGDWTPEMVWDTGFTNTFSSASC